LQPQIVTKPAFTVVGMRIHTKGLSPEIPTLWQTFGPRMNEIPQRGEQGTNDDAHVDHAAYGLMDNYDHENNELDYMAGESVLRVDELPEGMSRWDVPANTYAVFETTLPTIGQTFDHIYNRWLPTSGYTQAPAPYFERYGEEFDPDVPDSTLSIYIPVQKK
jgi:AraC family transcriptional regulator